MEQTTAPTQSPLDSLLARLQDRGDFPAFSKSIAEINRLTSSSRADTGSASELANVVLRDYSLTNKLLRLVNSAFYGPFSGRITTVSRAVVILGFEQVRLAAASLLILESLKNRDLQTVLQEAVARSLVSGFIARDLAAEARLNQPEEALVCAMLHDLGRLLLLYSFPEEHRRITDLIAQGNMAEGEAVGAILGVSYVELGMGVARLWQFPETVIQSMRPLPPGPIKRPLTEDGQLHCLSNFSSELCRIIGHEDPTEREDQLQALLTRFEAAVPLSRNRLETLLSSAADHLTRYSEILKIDLQETALLRGLRKVTTVRREAHDSSNRTEPLRDDSRSEPPDPLGPVELREIPRDPESSIGDRRQEILIDGIQEVTNALLEEYDLNSLLTMILETIYRGFGFQRVIFCLMAPNRRRMQARFGFGRDMDRLLREFGFEVRQRADLFSLALSKASDIGIDHAADPGIQKAIPGWFGRIISAPAFALFPVVIHKRPTALIYVDRGQSGRVIDSGQLNYMRILRNQAVMAIKQKATSSPAA
jgi:HD-like signal output (HDOD) protein